MFKVGQAFSAVVRQCLVNIKNLLKFLKEVVPGSPILLCCMASIFVRPAVAVALTYPKLRIISNVCGY